MRKHSTRYPAEVRERAIRLVLDHQGNHGAQLATVVSITSKMGCTAGTLRRWVRQAARNSVVASCPTTHDSERIRALEREVGELRQANEILRNASAYFAKAELDRPFK